MTRQGKEKGLTARQAERMGRILESARDLLGEIGMERMTMRDLAAASGVSAATLYNRFGTKDSLVAHAVVDHYEQAIAKVMARSLRAETPVEQLAHTVRVIVRDSHSRPGFSAALMSAYFKINNEREMPNRLYAALMQSFLPPLQALQGSGDLHRWVVLPVLAEELCDGMFGIVMKWSQGMVPDTAFVDRALLAVLLPVLASLKSTRAAELAALLATVSGRLSRPPARRSRVT